MSNKLNNNPLQIDTFNADAIIASNPITVRKVVLFSAAAGDIFKLFHGVSNTGIEAIILKQNATLTVEVDFGPRGMIFPNGLFLSAVDCSGLDSGTDKVLVYLR